MRAIPLPKMEFVTVVWKDSNFAPGWNNVHRITASIPEVRSVGWVTYSDKEILEIASHIGDEGARLNPTSIPWRAIMNVKKVAL